VRRSESRRLFGSNSLQQRLESWAFRARAELSQAGQGGTPGPQPARPVDSLPTVTNEPAVTILSRSDRNGLPVPITAIDEIRPLVRQVSRTEMQMSPNSRWKGLGRNQKRGDSRIIAQHLAMDGVVRMLANEAIELTPGSEPSDRTHSRGGCNNTATRIPILDARPKIAFIRWQGEAFVHAELQEI